MAATPMPLEYDVLNKILTYVQDTIFKGVAPLQKTATYLFGALITIDLVLAVILNFKNSDYMQLLVKKILKYGLVYYLILHFGQVLTWVFNGFVWIGVHGGAAAVDHQTIFNPAHYSEIGVRICMGLLMNAALMQTPLFGNTFLIFGLLILFSLGIIAINFGVTYLEFYGLAILSLIFIPFGANKYTAWIAQKIGNMIFAFGVKIMVLSFLAAVAIPILENWTLPNTLNPETFIQSMLYMSLGSVFLAILSWHAPSLAATLLGGMPSIHANHVVQPVMGVMANVGGTMLTGGSSTALQMAAGSAAAGKGAVQSAAQIQK